MIPDTHLHEGESNSNGKEGNAHGQILNELIRAKQQSFSTSKVISNIQTVAGQTIRSNMANLPISKVMSISDFCKSFSQKEKVNARIRTGDITMDPLIMGKDLVKEK